MGTSGGPQTVARWERCVQQTPHDLPGLAPPHVEYYQFQNDRFNPADATGGSVYRKRKKTQPFQFFGGWHVRSYGTFLVLLFCYCCIYEPTIK